MKEIVTVCLTGVKPHPWAASEISSFTSKKTGRRHTFAKKDKNLEIFQEAFRRAAMAAMRDRRPHQGACLLQVGVGIAHPDPASWKRWAVSPTWFGQESTSDVQRGDLTNYVKAAEDALKGVAFTDDVYVVCQCNAIVWYEKDFVKVTVKAIEAWDQVEL